MSVATLHTLLSWPRPRNILRPHSAHPRQQQAAVLLYRKIRLRSPFITFFRVSKNTISPSLIFPLLTSDMRHRAPFSLFLTGKPRSNEC